MGDEDITGLSVKIDNPWSKDNWSWEIVATDKSNSDDMNIQQRIDELESKNYGLEYKNKELTDKINSLESELIGLMCKVDDLEQIIVKICEDFILSNDD